MDNTCKTCLWWIRMNASEGECHRHAPVPIVGMREAEEPDNFGAYWPETGEDDFCGEWNPLPQKQVSG